MDVIRFNRRENDSLIFSNDAGEFFSIAADEQLLSEVRNAVRATTDTQKVNPRILQALIRAGKTREEIVATTGAEIIDIERYEGPVIAEREFMLTRAHQVRVKTTSSEQAEQQFGSVIAERLIALNALNIKWLSWRDEEAGWMITLEFDENSTARKAVWSFDHKKMMLTPLTPDAVNLSRQTEPGDSLIPKLRAVDDLVSNERFDSGAFTRGTLDQQVDSTETQNDAMRNPSLKTDEISGETVQAMSPAKEAAYRSGHPSTGSIPIIHNTDEFMRRREIEERAISTAEEEPQDLGETADLLDALRRRRNERDRSESTTADNADSDEPPAPILLHQETSVEFIAESSDEPKHSSQSDPSDMTEIDDSAPQTQTKKPRGRTSIPSWDDILFGTRGDNDNT